MWKFQVDILQPNWNLYNSGLPSLGLLSKRAGLTLPPHLPCDAAARLTIQCFQAIVNLQQGVVGVQEVLEKCTLPSSHLRLTECFLASIRPAAPYFLRPNERKLVQCSIDSTSSVPALDYSSLLLVLHKDFKSQLSIVSSSASADGATMILQNLSPEPFSLHPDVSLGQAMSWPTPLTA